MLEQQVIAASKIVEDHLDTQLERLDKLDDKELQDMRKARMLEMKNQLRQKEAWRAAGHGEYTELTEKREFFDASKRSERLICHFYVNTSENCKIIDKHFSLLAPAHLETRFCKMNAEKTPFLVEKLMVKLMPDLVMVFDGRIVGHIRGFDSLGGRYDFPTSVLEKRLAEYEVLWSPQSLVSAQASTSKKTVVHKHEKSKDAKSIRCSEKTKDDTDSDDDW